MASNPLGEREKGFESKDVKDHDAQLLAKLRADLAKKDAEKAAAQAAVVDAGGDPETVYSDDEDWDDERDAVSVVEFLEFRCV
jgi:hypothetical protein